MKNKLYALQGIRALAAMSIFLFHAGIPRVDAFAVTFFFMMSGFFMYYTKRDSIKPLTGINKIKKMYPLHIVMFISSLAIGNTLDDKSINFVVKGAILQLTLLQAWFMDYVVTYNGLAWYLSVTFFLYLISYPLVKFVKKISKPILITGIVIVFMITIHGLIEWKVLYFNPLYRTCDFILGMLMAKIFTENKYKITQIKYDFIEISLVVWFFVQYAISQFWRGGAAPCYYSLLFAVTLYVFAHSQGVISKILSHDVFDKFANVSFEFYMIHEQMLILWRKIFSNIELSYIINIIVVTMVAFICTIISIIFWKKIEKRVWKQ